MCLYLSQFLIYFKFLIGLKAVLTYSIKTFYRFSPQSNKFCHPMKIRFTDKIRQTLLCVIIFQIISFSGFSLRFPNGYKKKVVVGDSLFKTYKSSEFEKIKSEVSKSKKLIFIDFYADWCGPCRMLAPVLEQVTGAKIVKVNTDENAGLASKHNISSIPKLLFMKDGQIVDQLIGLVSKQAIQSKIDALNN